MIKRTLESITGYWIYKAAHLPIGTDLRIDLHRLRITPGTIFDIGANEGQSCARFRREFPKATIYAFEPVSATFGALCRSVAGDPLVIPRRLAFGAAVSEAVIYTGGLSVLSTLRPDLAIGTQSEMVSVTTVDACSVERIDLLKIDTEGFEVQVLRGAANMLRNGAISAVFAEVGFTTDNTRNTYFGDVAELLSEFGYRFHGLYDVAQYPDVAPFGNALFVKPRRVDA